MLSLRYIRTASIQNQICQSTFQLIYRFWSPAERSVALPGFHPKSVIGFSKLINKQIDFQQLLIRIIFKLILATHLSLWQIYKKSKRKKRRMTKEEWNILKCHQFILLQNWNLIISHYKFFYCVFVAPFQLLSLFLLISTHFKRTRLEFPQWKSIEFEFNF